MKPDKKHIAILAIPEMDDTTVTDARKLFFGYKEKEIITEGTFDDDVWGLCDEYARYHLDFSFDSSCLEFVEFSCRFHITADEYKNYMKTYIMCRMGELALVSLQKILHIMKKIACSKNDDLEEYLKETSEKGTLPRQVSEFFSILPEEGRELELTKLLDLFDEAEELAFTKNNGRQRTLATFESYFRFDELLRRFWSESGDKDEKLFFFPIWLWWNVSAILPLRPREFVLTPRNCLDEVDGKYFLTVRRNNIKGTGKTKSYKISDDYKSMRYQIPKRLAHEIQWYLEATQYFRAADIKTLFVTGTHYAMWERNAPYTSRYFTYINLRTCLRYFYEMIVQERYGYTIIFDNARGLTHDKEIEYLHLGDTRHIALINMIAEGATPVVAMMLAGHDNPEMSSHYYSNITTLIECRTYRQYKKMIKGQQNYALSTRQQKLIVKDFMILENGGRCYSGKMKSHDFSDCYKASGPAGEIGYCQNCDFYRDENKTFKDAKEFYQNRIACECELLEQIIKKVRCGKGEPEEIKSILLRLRDSDYSYQQYLLEECMEEENHGKE